MHLVATSLPWCAYGTGASDVFPVARRRRTYSGDVSVVQDLCSDCDAHCVICVVYRV